MSKFELNWTTFCKINFSSEFWYFFLTHTLFGYVITEFPILIKTFSWWQITFYRFYPSCKGCLGLCPIMIHIIHWIVGFYKEGKLGIYEISNRHHYASQSLFNLFKSRLLTRARLQCRRKANYRIFILFWYFFLLWFLLTFLQILGHPS